jgi:hypothetical protein
VPYAVLETAVTERGFWLLATGTGRCGTGYFARVLNSTGMQCSHEGLFRTDHPAETRRRIQERIDNAWWGWEAESSWLAAPHLWRPEMEGMTVVHLVREPKKVIDSQMRIRAFDREDDTFYRWQLRWLPELAEMEPVERAVYFYVKWNAMIEPFASLRWRIEDDVCGLLSLLEVDTDGKELFDDKRYNSRAGFRSSDVDLDGLREPLRSALRKTGERYGYE